MFKEILHKGSVTCKHCGSEGTLVIYRSGINVKKDDRISHQTDCPLRKKTQPKHFIKKKWEKQEKLANDLVSASPTIASGAMFKDGDGRRLYDWRIECKQTKNNSMRLKKSVWVELLYKCNPNGEIPLLHLEINKDKFVCIPLSHSLPETWEGEYVKNEKLSINIWNSIKTPTVFEMHYGDQKPPKMVLMSELEFKDLKEKLNV